MLISNVMANTLGVKKMNKRKSGVLGRREFVGATVASTLLAVGGSSLLSAVSATQKRPNVVFILADDLGWGDLSIYGEPNFSTPNLDRLAQQGVRFTNAYSGQTVCTPTRVSFFTGRYPARLAIGLKEPLGSITQVSDSVGLPTDFPTIASLLKARGYETALVGKWHCGYPPSYGPWNNGFDEYFGNLSGAADYFRHVDTDGKPDLWEGQEKENKTSYSKIEQAGYLTDLYTQQAVDFINRPRQSPFYLSLHYNAPHWPFEGPDDEAISNSLIGQDNVQNWLNSGSPESYAALVGRLDDGIGRVLQALEDAGLAENTLVIFASDNGGERLSYFGPLRGKKGDLLEGGIRVPTIVRWPGVTPANQVSEQAIITMDLTATILAATHTKPDPRYPLDGQNLIPVLKGEKPVYPRTLFWRFGGDSSGGTNIQKAVRSGDWKYLLRGGNEYLYNLANDQGEQNDLQQKYPKIFQKLRTKLQQWESQVLPYPTA